MKQFINGGPQSVGFAMSIILICLAAFIIFSNQRLVGVRKSYATIGGKGGRSNEMKLGGAKIPLMGFIVIFLFFAMVAPMFVLVMETFQVTTGAGYGLKNLTTTGWAPRKTPLSTLTTTAFCGTPSSARPSGTPSG